MIACSRALYASTSAIALLASGALSPVLAIDVASRLSPAGLGQPSAPGGGGNAGAAGIATIANPALQAQIALSSANLAKAAQAIKDMNAAQAAARATSQLTLNGVKLSGKLAGSAWTGAVLSGLKPVDEGDPTLWVNAEGLQKDAGAATATVKQTAANALLNWQSFDLEKGETLVFDQQDHSDWTVLNRIVAGPRDPVTGSRAVASPTRILGKIEAPGSVYVINPNGIIFGATAEINVHSLIASSLDVGNAAMSLAERDNFFLNTGILGSGSAIPVASFSYDARDKKVEGDVKVEAGAIINTSLAPRSVSPDAGGFVYLFAPSVENDGSIVTPAGETMLVAAQTVRLTPNAYPDGGISLDSDDHQKQTFRGVGFETSLDPSVWRQDGDPGALISAPGSAINNGLIDAERGVVILNGDYVANGASGQNSGAVIRANTSITRNGEIFLDARLQLTLNGGIQILPAENGETIPKSAIGNFKPGSIEMRGQTVDLEPGALVVAPGASVSITSFVGNHGIYPGPVADSIPPTAARIYMAPGASIDVSGLNGVTLPMSANLVSFKPFGNEFADQPLQRDGALRGLELTVDIRETGSRDGVAWIGTPLANVSGFANTVPQTLEQLLTTGGNVSFSAPSGNAILRQGSTINVGGGYVQYEAGVVNTSKLLTADGRIVDIARADPLETYVGVAGVSLDTHPKWGVTNSFVNPLVGGGTFQPGYTEGHDAGGVTLNAQNYALDGTFYAGAVAGERQRLNGRRPDSANANTIKADPNAMPSAGYFSLTGLNNLIVSESLTPLPAAFSLNDELPVNRTDNARLAASALTDANFAHVSANFIGHIDVSEDALLKVAPGGTISLTGGSVDIEGQLTARSGAIFIEATAHIVGDSLNAKDTSFKPVQPSADGFFDLTIGPRAVLDASGLWVNDANTAPEDFVGAAFIDGGTVRLTTDSRSAICASLLCKQIPGLGTDAIVDLTGSIVLSAGSFIDVSSGGRVTDHGVIQLDSNGRPAGNGGNVALQTYQGSSFATTAPLNPTLPLTARIVLQASDGTPDGNAQALNQAISARGFGHGGALSIETLGIEIGGSGSGAADVLSLPESFFAGNAFGSYDLAAVSGGIVLAPDVTLRLQQSNFLASDDLLPLPTGAKVSQFAGTGTLPDILRAPVDLALSAALPPLPLAPYDPAIVVAPAQVAIRIGEGAAIEGDPGADIRIHVAGRDAFTPATGFDFTAAIAQQIGVAEILGSIRAPGGTIALSGAANSEIWLGATSRLDVSGVVIADARQPSFRTGEILSGGTVTIVTTGQNASVVAEHGAVIDVSGAAGTFDLLRDPMANGLDGEQRVATALWSDAGTIAITTATLLYDGSFAAHAGAESGRGGTLIIAVPDLLVGREEITVLQGGEMVPEGLQPTDDLAKILAEKFHDRLDADTLKNDGSLQKLWDFVFFQADRLIGSGISDLTLSASPTAGDTVGASQGKFAPGRINFQGDVTIGGLTNLALDASGISITDASGHLLATDVPPAGADACDVCLDASYVALRGAGGLAPNNNFLPQEGAGILRIAGDAIDIAAGGFNVPGSAGLLSFSGIAHTTLVSTGDIRLRVPLANVTLDLTPGTLPAGEVITAGDLTLQAAQIYPISSVDITLKSLATDGTIAFGATGNPVAAPLSAGGQVTVSAAHIVQGGRLLAPLGTIQLGAQGADDLSPNDPAPNLIFSSASQDTNAARPTKTVTFTAGSTTSVSLAGQVVPFGRTANGTSWSYDSSNGQPLTAPPEKNLLVSGAAIDVAAGATLDVTGGGDIRAMEFVPGIGGTRDVLANGSNVYAIIPGYDPAAAPLDLDFILPKSILNIAQPGDAVPLAGSRVFLSGAPGLPAGYYTLLPAHYATLPGAYRVSVVANSRDALASTNNVLPDGTLRTAGFFAEPGAGTRDAQSQFFDVQSSAVWRQYSEIDQTTGNTFFGPKTVGTSALPPPLPADAGHAVFNAVSGLNLDGILRASPAVLAATGNIKTGSVIIKNLSTEAIRQLYLNQAVAGPGISPGAKIIEIGVDSIAISEPATADTASESLTFSGRGAKFDIAARDIEVLSPGSAARNDQILPLDVTQLSGLGAESLLIGGVRSMGSEGEIISVVANAVEIHNDATMPLQAPEIILVAKAGAANGDINAGLNVRLDAGSVVRAVGTVSDPTPRTLTIENAVAEDALAGTRANGALLAVSNGGPLTVLRPKAQTNGTITIIGDDAVPGISGARIEGASLTLDTSGIIRLNSGATVQTDDISVSARGINFGAVTGAPGGFIVADDILVQFQQAETLTFRSGANGINFYGDVDLTLARAGSLLVLDSGTLAAPVAGSVIVKAGAVVLRNSGDSPASKNAVVGKGVLQVAGSTVEIGSGDKLLSGFATVNFAASEEIAVRELGSMTVLADLAFQTPRFLVGSGANQSVTVAGAVRFGGTGDGIPVATPEIGGTLNVAGTSIEVASNALIQARAGGISLEATTGDVALGAGARLLANGYEQTFFDVTRVAPGGAVKLTADHGNIDIDAAAVIDISSPGGHPGNAGTIALVASNGRIASHGGTLDMGAIAGSVAGDSGGRLKIQVQTLGTESVSIPSLFSDTVDLRVSHGDLRLASDLDSAIVTLTADSGVLTIDRRIDASGEKGGTISLFGGRGVVFAPGAAVLATASDAGKRGGEILIGTEVASANGSLGDGVIALDAGIIDVSNTANPENGGTVRLRAPFIGIDGDNVPDDVAIDTVQTLIRGASNVTVEAFKVYDTSNSAFNGIIDPVSQAEFYGSCAAGVSGVECSGTLIEFVQKFALSAASQAKFAAISPEVLHLQPGMELVNNDPTVNNGDITVAKTWNLGAGTAGPLYSAQDFSTKVGKDIHFYAAGTAMFDAFGNPLHPDFNKYKGGLLYIPGDTVIPELDTDGNPIKNADESVKTVLIHGTSHISFLDYRVGGSVTGEAGTLTLRASRDVNINASITDGFFQTRNVFDDTYQANLNNWLNLAYAGQAGINVSNVGGYLIGGGAFADPVALGFFAPGPVPVAPYDPAANAISPPATGGKDKIPLTGADLFPLIPDAAGPIKGVGGNYRAVQSWSYRIAGGADIASANPLGLRPLSAFQDSSDVPNFGHGNVVMDGNRQYDVFNSNVGSNITYVTPTMVRTGTGAIDIAAARDFLLADTKAPGVVYTAGRKSVDLPDPNFVLQTIDDPLNVGETITLPVATNPAGFLKPIVLSCDPTYFCNPYGPLGQAAYPVAGGHLTLTAQRDIIGFEHPTIRYPINGAGAQGYPNQQYFAPWLLAQGTFLPITDFGAFSPLSGYLSATVPFTPSQTSWWINFGSFDQGFMSVGGDVRIEAGRDIQELAVSLPTTARTSGGLSSTITDADGKTVANIPAVHLNGSGDLTVIAGRDLKSGAYYEGSGDARIEVGGTVSASWLDRPDIGNPFTIPVSTVLAVDTGTIALTARGNVDIAGVVSATSLQTVFDSTFSVDLGAQAVSSYGPSSKVAVQSIAGDLIANSLTYGLSLINNPTLINNIGDAGPVYPGVHRYPASFEAVALKGDVDIADYFQLAPSDTGTLALLAYDSLHTFSSVIGTEPISAGPSLVERVFDPNRPLAGFGPEQGSLASDLGSLLLHVDDPTPDLFYAATGDFISGLANGAISRLDSDGIITPLRPIALEINKPARVHAAGDIVDLSFFGQNLAPADTTDIIAGRDIFYTGAWQNLIGRSAGVLGEPENLGGLSIAGPGFFDIEAGRNLGPFVTAAGDIFASTTANPNPNGTGIITFGNTLVAGNRRMLDDHRLDFADPFAQGANDKLPRQGASIVALFGVGKGVNYQGVISDYIDPATSISPRDYAPALADYLLTLGTYTRKDGTKQTFTLQDWQNFSQSQDAAALFEIFDSLASPTLRHIFVDEIVFNEMRLTGDASGCCSKQYSVGYSAIETLFPAAFGYTDNHVAAEQPAGGSAPGDGSNGGFGLFASTPAVRINTGNLEILHATIKTLQGAEDFTVRLNDTDATTASVGRHIVKIGGTVTAGDVVTETINGTVYSYTPAEGDTPDRIANGLRDAILSNPPQGIEVGAVGKGTSSFTLLETRPGATFSGSTLSSATVAALIAGGAGLEGLDAQQLIAATETIANAGPVAVGGNVSLLGPGGDINVGTTAVEVNPKLSNSSLGILTLNNGGIDVFTDGNVLVNQSRILTVQGGDLFMWSSNGDLDAGRGAKTTVDFKPLSVNFDPRDLQTINLNGLVSGAGIGTIQSTPDAPSASISLVTPRGKINAGDAGLRASGDVNLTCGDQRTQVTCIINAANIVAFGSVTGVPTATVDIAGLESTSSVAGQAAQAAADAVAAASNQGAPPAMRPAPSLISVEVLGFGDCDPEAGMRCTQ